MTGSWCLECLAPSLNPYCSDACVDRGRARLADFVTKFWARVEKGEGSCWTWRGSQTADGYGHLRLPTGELEYSHRLAFRVEKGPIPAGTVLDHLCRNRACCNPAHLEAVTPAENTRRGLAPYGLRTTCRHGHDITDPANVYTAPRGDHRCRICARIRDKARSAA